MQPWPPLRDVAKRRRIVARQHHPLRPAHQPLQAGARQIAGGVLDAEDVRQPGQPRQGVVGDIGAGPRGHVVDQQRNVHRLGDGGVVTIEPLLAGTIVIGRHDQRRGGPDVLGVPGQLDGLGGGVGAGAGDHRHAPRGGLHAEFNDVAVLVVAERRGLAGGANRDKAMHATGDLPLDQGHEGVVVDDPATKWRDERRGKRRGTKVESWVQEAVNSPGVNRIVWEASDNMSARRAPARSALVDPLAPWRSLGLENSPPPRPSERRLRSDSGRDRRRWRRSGAKRRRWRHGANLPIFAAPDAG